MLGVVFDGLEVVFFCVMMNDLDFVLVMGNEVCVWNVEYGCYWFRYGVLCVLVWMVRWMIWFWIFLRGSL